jgi:hypothetical protein
MGQTSHQAFLGSKLVLTSSLKMEVSRFCETSVYSSILRGVEECRLLGCCAV